MISVPKLSENLKRARRRLEEIPEVTILDDWAWDTYSEQFYIHVCIDLDKEYSSIPRKTEWYITSNSAYPSGSINVYPSINNGISVTFPHQANNASIAQNNLWRLGKLCVTLSTLTLGTSAPEKEPFTVDERLYWYTRRAVLWLYAAATNELMPDGEFFELPDFETTKNNINIAFNEDIVSMIQWEDTELNYGIAKVYHKKLRGSESIAAVQKFQSIETTESIYLPHWGTFLQPEENEKLEDALWIKLSAPPVIKQWQAPSTLGELRMACKAQGNDFMEMLKIFAPKARDGRPHLVLLGFPIPVRAGEPPSEMSWQGLELPVLSNGKYTNRCFQSGKRKSGKGLSKGAPAGFRPGEVGWWHNDILTILRDDMALKWLNSQNWSPRTISARGQLPSAIRSKNIAIIGVGSLGASIAELLVREGVTRLTCIDGDYLDIGNLCRHTLTMQDVFRNKSEALTERLQEINPCAIVKGVADYEKTDEEGTVEPDLSNYDIIIETTGEDYILDMLSSGHYKHDTVFCSVSVGLGAKRIYLGLLRTCRPDFSAFLELSEPYFECDRDECDLKSLPRDGVGCWHPLFPARSDDMWMAACSSVKVLESFMDRTMEKSLIVIYEALNNEGLFAGYQPIEVKCNEL